MAPAAGLTPARACAGNERPSQAKAYSFCFGALPALPQPAALGPGRVGLGRSVWCRCRHGAGGGPDARACLCGRGAAGAAAAGRLAVHTFRVFATLTPQF